MNNEIKVISYISIYFKMQLSINEPHQVRYDMKYLFAYYDPEDKCWAVPPRRFILNEVKELNQLNGQFITSGWFNREFKLGDELHFIITAVHQYKSSTDFEKDLNKLKNPFPSFHDMPSYVKNSGYYIMNQDIMVRSLIQFKMTDSFDFTLKSITNQHQKLTLKLIKNHCHTNSMFITCPSFTDSLI